MRLASKLFLFVILGFTLASCSGVSRRQLRRELLHRRLGFGRPRRHAAFSNFTNRGNATALPPFFGIATNQQVRTTAGRLSVDGAQTITAIAVGSTISTSALYLGTTSNPAFTAQPVRAH